MEADARRALDPMYHRATEGEVRDRLLAVAAGSVVGDRDSALLAVSVFALVDALRDVGHAIRSR